MTPPRESAWDSTERDLPAAPSPTASPPPPAAQEIRWLQLAKLRELIRRVADSNPFYSARLGAAGDPLEPASLEDFSARFPLTRKHALIQDQLKHPPYGTNLTHALAEYTRCHQTSGSTGEPLRWLDTPESWRCLLGNWRVIFDAAGVTPEDRLLFAFSFGPFLGFWSAMEAAMQAGWFVFAAGSMTTEARLRVIGEHNITVVCCTPTYALHMGETALARKLDRARESVRLLVVAGEPGGSIPATRDRLSQCWPRARVFDHYGMTEVGPVTYECPVAPGTMHVIESAYLAEIVDAQTGAPLPHGQPGELVLTTLDRVGSPVIRYRTGDLVQARSRGPCACGRHDLALEGGILGRCDDMVVVRGVNVYPSAVEEIVRRCGGVAEYRVNLDCRGALPELSLEIEPLPQCRHPLKLARDVQQALQTALALRIPVRAVEPGSLPRFEMKSRRWIRTYA